MKCGGQRDDSMSRRKSLLLPPVTDSLLCFMAFYSYVIFSGMSHRVQSHWVQSGRSADKGEVDVRWSDRGGNFTHTYTHNDIH